MVEISFWPETVARWRKEGLPEGVAPDDFFGLDRIDIRRPFDGSLLLAEQVIEENEDYKLEKNSNGVTVKSWKKSYATPSEIDFSIKTAEDWRIARRSLEILEERFDPKTALSGAESTQDNLLRAITPTDAIWFAITLLGFERAMDAMISEPEFFDDIIGTYTRFVLKLCGHALKKGLRCDAIWFFADLCYKNGMLFSPRMYRERFQQYHRMVRQFCDEHHLFLILHCDGDVRQFLPLLIETGFDCIQPLEARAGNDVRELKKKYAGKICLFGNINMDVLARGDRVEIADEVISKVEAAKKDGGYIFHSDHSVPPTVSFDAYCLAHELARKHGN